MAADRSEFPAIDSSFRFHPYPSGFVPTKAASTAISSTLYSYSSGLTSTVTRIEITLINSIYTTPNPFMASTSTGPVPVPTTPTADTSTEGTTGITRGAKIGIAVGIAVTVLLSLLIVVIFAADFRRRRRRKMEAQKRQTQDSELSLWETELKKGRVGEPTTTRKVEISGPHGTVSSVGSESMTTREVDIPGQRGSVSSGGKDPMTTRKADVSVRRGSVSEGGREWEWQPAYMPKERYSMGSMSVPIVNPATRSSLDGLVEKPRPFR
jgi:hypothetical protein